MANKNILGEEQITMVELKAELEKIQKRDEELNFRAQRTQEYLNSVVSLKKKNADDLRKKLNGLKIPRLREEHITKIIDLTPKTLEELKTIMAAYIVTLSADQMKKIVETVNSVA